MKKLTFILLAVAGSMALVGCSSDDDKGSVLDCVTLGNKVADASVAYNTNESNENCIKLRDALKAAIDAGCTTTIYQEWLNDLPCN